jgi:hypothetical protein
MQDFLKQAARLLKRLRPEAKAALAGMAAALLLLFLVLSNRGINVKKFANYRKMLGAEEIEVCASSSGKTYEDYRMITDGTCNQYKLIKSKLKVDKKTGFLYDKDGFLAVALGYQFGPVGTRYYFTLDTGIVLPLIKTDEKDPKDASDGCAVDINGTVIEFVIDADAALKHFGTITNGLVLDGNYNNSPDFAGSIVKIERILQ